MVFSNINHFVDLKGEVVFARVTMEQDSIKEETAHIIDLWDGNYGEDKLNITRPVNISAERFQDLFYRDLKSGCCDFQLAECSPELIIKPGGYQIGDVVVLKDHSQETITTLSDNSGNSGDHGFWGNISVPTASQLYARANNSSGKVTASALSAGGRGWMASTDTSFSVLEMVTVNLEKDLGLDRQCWDACTTLQMQAEVVETLDIANYFKECKPAKECVMNADELAMVLSTSDSERSPLKPVKAGDKLAIDIEYSNSEPTTRSTVFRLHFLIKNNDGNYPGYTKDIASLFGKPLKI